MDLGSSPPLAQDEEILGLYKNPDENEQVLFTTQGVYLPETMKWRGVKYADIVSVDTPGDKKSTVLQLNLINGEIFLLPIRGMQKDRFFDSLEVLRFLDRVIAVKNPI